MSKLEKVFFYGTLRMRGYNFERFGPQKLMRVGRTAPAYTLISLGAYPALIEGGLTPVVGEVHEISEEHLQKLDSMEYGAGYYRDYIVMEDGEKVWGYMMIPRGQREEIPSGDWEKKGATL